MKNEDADSTLKSKHPVQTIGISKLAIYRNPLWCCHCFSTSVESATRASRFLCSGLSWLLKPSSKALHWCIDFFLPLRHLLMCVSSKKKKKKKCWPLGKAVKDKKKKKKILKREEAGQAALCPDLCDFDVVLRRRLTQTGQVWVLGPTVRE